MISRLSIPGAWMWSAWQADRGMNFNSYLFDCAISGRDGAKGLIAVDPLPLDEDAIAWLRDAGGVSAIAITNRDHRRAAAQLGDVFGARTIEDPSEGEEIFPGAYALRIPHGKAPEYAIHLPGARAAVVGDALIGSPAGALSLLPDEKLENPAALLLTLRKLWALELHSLLLCDGQPIFGAADAALGALLESRGGPAINRINVADLSFEPRAQGRFEAVSGEVGLLIGARRLGYRVARLPARKAFCPLHSHEAGEEFYYVIDGEPSVRTLRGTIRCRAGDFIAFPTGERGTHELRNDGDAPCTVLLVGAHEGVEVCRYPDSSKVLVESGGGGRLIVRAMPQLDYYDGE